MWRFLLFPSLLATENLQNHFIFEFRIFTKFLLLAKFHQLKTGLRLPVGQRVFRLQWPVGTSLELAATAYEDGRNRDRCGQKAGNGSGGREAVGLRNCLKVAVRYDNVKQLPIRTDRNLCHMLRLTSAPGSVFETLNPKVRPTWNGVLQDPNL